MISCIVIMLLFWHYQKLSQLDPGVKISLTHPSLDTLTPPPPPQLIDDKVLFAFYIYLIISMISWIVKMLLF